MIFKKTSGKLFATILDKTVEKIVYLDSIFLNIVAVPVLSSPPPLKAMFLCIQKKAWSLGVCGKQH